MDFSLCSMRTQALVMRRFLGVYPGITKVFISICIIIIIFGVYPGINISIIISIIISISIISITIGVYPGATRSPNPRSSVSKSSQYRALDFR